MPRKWIRDDQADIRVSFEGTPYGDSWKQVAGGNLSADDTKVRPGGMGREQAAGGPASRGDLTVEIPQDDTTVAWIANLEEMVGWGEAKVAVNFLKKPGEPNGVTRNRTGIVKEVNPADMGGGTGVGMLSVVITCDELAA
jgi:hypothetical protein